MKRKARFVLTACAAAVVGAPSLSRAANATWTFNGSGSWSVASNWLGGVPAAASAAIVSNNDAVNRTITYDYTGVPVTLGTITLDNLGTGSTILTQSANTITTSSGLLIGNGGKGYWTITGGTATLAGPAFALDLGESVAGRGTGTIGGTAVVNVNKTEVIGNSGAGTLIQSGGTHAIGAGTVVNLFIGLSNGGSGSYFLSGTGILSVSGTEFIGQGGAATFNQSGGTNAIGTATATSGVILGGLGTGSGTYLLSDGALNVFGTESVGQNNSGVFIQSGGTHTFGSATVSGGLFVGAQAAGGTYSLSGNGILNGFGEEDIGYTSAGTFIQTGGVNNILATSGSFPGVIRVGDQPSGSGTYSLSGTGVINSAGNEQIGNTGTGLFLQSGGTNTIGAASTNTALEIGLGGAGVGTYSLTGGALSVIGTEFIGESGHATFSQSAGMHSILQGVGIPVFEVGLFSGSVGTYLLSGTGLLNSTANETIGASGTGAFIQSGGTHLLGSAGASRTLSIANSGGSLGSYSLGGTGVLTAFGSEFIGQGGTGLFTQSGGTHTLGSATATSNSLVIAPLGTAVGTYSLGGGALTVFGNEIVGGVGTAAFMQTGGANTIGSTAAQGTLVLGNGVGGNGSYSLSGPGALAVNGSELIGNFGVGTFIHGSGTHTLGSVAAPGLMLVGDNQGSAGTYQLSGGTFNVLGEVDVGYLGSGTFIQSSGVHSLGLPTLSSSLILGNGTNATGNYALNDGTLVINGFEYVGYNGIGTFNQSSGTHTVANGVLSISAFGGAGTYILAGGALTAASAVVYPGGTFIQQAGTFSGVLDNQGAYIYSGGTFSGHLINEGAASLLVDFDAHNGLDNLASMTIAAPLTVSVDGLPLNNTGQIYLAGGRISGSATLQNSGLISGFGTFGGTGQLINNSAIIQSGGNLYFSNPQIVNTGNIDLGEGLSAILSGGSLDNSGVIRLNGARVSGAATLNNNLGGAVSGWGNISTPFNNAGLLLVDGGELITPAFISTGQVVLTSALASIRGGTYTNSGVVSGTGRIASNFVNTSSGEIRAFGGDSLQFQTAGIGSAGKITLGGGAVDFTQGLNNTGTISGHGQLFMGAGLTNAGTMNLSGGPTDIYCTLVNTGKISVAGGSNTTFYNDVNTTAGSITVSAGSAVTFFGDVNGVGQITGSGIKDFESTASLGPINSITGTTVVGGAGNLNAGFIRDSALYVDGKASIAPNGTTAGTSKVNSLAIAGSPGNWTGKLDLADNDLIIDYTGSSPLNDVRDQIITARAGGAWSGNGITTSMGDTIHHTLGYAENSVLGLSSFSGQSVDSSSLLVKYTWYADANLDGVVDIKDLYVLALHYNTAGDLWTTGDYNNDGVVNVADLTLLALNWQAGFGAPLGPASLEAALANLGLPPVSVPEPTALAGLTGLCGLIARRRWRAGRFNHG